MSTAAPYLDPAGQRGMTGFKYHRITGRTDHKEPYRRFEALRTAAWHAADFVNNRRAQIEWLAGGMDRPPVVTSMYDAELFGHWWFEGPDWLEAVLRGLPAAGIAVISPAQYLETHPDSFRHAVGLVSRDLLAMWLSAYQSDLWNRAIGRALAARAADVRVVELPTGPIAVPLPGTGPRAFGWTVDTVLPLFHHRTRIEDTVLRAAAESVLAEEGMEWHDLKPRGLEVAWMAKAERRVWVSPREITIGPLLANPVNRHPSVTAGSIATIDELAPGRTLLGWGVGDTAVRLSGLKPARVKELEASTRLVRALSTSQRSVLPCTVRVTTTRRPSCDTRGCWRSLPSAPPMTPRALPDRSNHVSWRWPPTAVRYAISPVAATETAATPSASVTGSPVSVACATSSR